MDHFRDIGESFGYTFQRNFVALVKLFDKVQEARHAVRLAYSPPQRTLVDDLDVRRGEDTQRYFVVITYRRA